MFTKYTLGVILSLFLYLPAQAQDQSAEDSSLTDSLGTAVEVVTAVMGATTPDDMSPLALAAALLDQAADACARAQEDLEEGDPGMNFPECQARQAIAQRHWTMVDYYHGHYYAMENASILIRLAEAQTALAMAEKVRDEALVEAATATNTLAAVVAEGLHNEAEAANALAEVNAEGDRAEALATKDLELIEATAPIDLAPADFFHDRIEPTWLTDLMEEVQGLRTAQEAAIAFQNSVCTANPDTSWCP